MPLQTKVDDGSVDVDLVLLQITVRERKGGFPHSIVRSSMTARSIRFWQTAAFATPKRASEYRTPLSQQYMRTHEARRETLSSLVRGYIGATFVREWVGFWFRSAVPRSGSLNSGNDGASVVPPP